MRPMETRSDPAAQAAPRDPRKAEFEANKLSKACAAWSAPRSPISG